ncbi:LIM domain containing protein [Trichuris trichiura]|uniref:LIM domain containing protein n=1 Tax=Trichuris trichiura TaxID=36087 RepID=A0A077Z1K6_TRITR|nr:LIM domain containing protein [Trichuris trichiura]
MQAGGFGHSACFLCRQGITSDKFVEVGRRLIHYDCFKCRQCKEALRTESAKVHSNRFYCGPCYLRLFCARCNICKKSVFPQDVVTLRGKKVHQACLVCALCKAPLGIGQHYIVGEDLFCSPKCAYEKRKRDRAPPAPPKPAVVEKPPEEAKPAEEQKPAQGEAAAPPAAPEGGAAAPPAQEGAPATPAPTPEAASPPPAATPEGAPPAPAPTPEGAPPTPAPAPGEPAPAEKPPEGGAQPPPAQ